MNPNLQVEDVEASAPLVMSHSNGEHPLSYMVMSCTNDFQKKHGVLAIATGLFAGNKNHQGMTQNHPKLWMDEASKAWQLLMRQPPAVRKKVTVMRALEELELSLRLAICSWDSYIIIYIIIYIYYIYNYIIYYI